MAKIPPHIIDEIMQTSRIEEVIGEFVNLKRAGSNLKGLSPFTDEKSPSFVVSPAKQIFKCFSTGKGGSVVTFLMEKEHFSYPEALKWLADKYSIQLPEDVPATAEEMAAITERESLHIINEFAKEFFMNNMHESEEGKAIGLSYFEERGFRMDIVKKFQLGYCLNKSDDFTKAALAKGYKLEYLEKVGLVKSKDDRQFDFFRGRVMFPIHSVSGRTLGFGGRTLITDKKIAKYFNSPESIIYNKSEILYGLHFAKGDIVKYDNCFLCEGYTDVISMYQAGIQNVVSSSGTSLTKDQIKLIRRYTQTITILYDGDAPGIKASFRGIDLILEEGMNVKVVLFPEGEDPDSFSKSVSTTVLEAYIKEHTQDFVSFKTDILLKDSQNDPIKKSELIRDMIHSVGLIPDQITRSVYSKDIAKRFDISEEIVINELNKLRKGVIAKQTNEPEIRDIPINIIPVDHSQGVNLPEIDAFDFNEYDLIRKMIKYGPFAIEFEQINEHNEKLKAETSVIELILHELNIDDLFFDNPLYNKLHKIIAEGIVTNKTFYKPSFFLRHEDQEIVKFVSEIETEEYELSPQWLIKHKIETNTELDKLPQAIMGAIYSFKASKVKKRIQEIYLQLEEIDRKSQTEEFDEEKFTDLLSEQIALTKVDIVLSQKLGRIIH
jgi:DNA primase